MADLELHADEQEELLAETPVPRKSFGRWAALAAVGGAAFVGLAAWHGFGAAPVAADAPAVSFHADEVTEFFRKRGKGKGRKKSGPACQSIAKKAGSEEEKCGLPSNDKRLLWLSSSGVPASVKESFLSLVSSLPDGKPPSDLKVTVVYDTALMKESFWNAGLETWQNEKTAQNGMRFEKLASTMGKLTPDLVSGYFGGATKGPLGETMDSSWAYDEWSENSETGGLIGLGFPEPQSLSIFGTLMEPDEFLTMAKVMMGLAGESEGKDLLEKLQQKDTSAVEKIIDETDVWWSAGGNPDLIAFAYEAFPNVKAKLLEKVKAGKMLYVGRSAGAMVAAPNAAFSAEPTAATIDGLFSGGKVTGLNLIPTCIFKPHFKSDSWETYSDMVEEVSPYHVVRTPNGMAMRCEAGCCYKVGENPQALGWVTAGNEHLHEFFESLPPKPKKR